MAVKKINKPKKVQKTPGSTLSEDVMDFNARTAKDYRKITSWLLMPVVALAALAIGAMGLGLVQDSNAASCTDFNYRRGGSGQCVRYLQVMVNDVCPTYPPQAWGSYSCGDLVVDGSYGPMTETSVKAIQWSQENWFKAPSLRVDGVTNKQTWAALCRLMLDAESDSPGYRAAKSAGC